MMFRDEYKNAAQSIRADGYIKQKVLNKIKQEQEGKKMKKVNIYRIGAAVAACLALVVSIWAVDFSSNIPFTDKTSDSGQSNTENTVADYDEIYETVLKFKPEEPSFFEGLVDYATNAVGGGLKGSDDAEMIIEDYELYSAETEESFTTTDQNTNGSKQDSEYSETNNQVEGVHEADIVKTDGKYIYSFSNITYKVRIIKAGKEPELISEIDVKTDKFRPMSDMYLSGDKLVIIGYDYVETYAEQTVAIVYDVKDAKNPEKLYELRQSGYYYSSRLIGDKLYLISNYSVFYENIDKDKPETYVPCVEDIEYNGAVKADTLSINKVCSGPDYTVICGFDISSGKMVGTKSLLGGIYTLYCSTENIIVAGISENSKTSVSRYAIEDGKIEYKATGEIEGTLLNQFSIDEYKGNFRFVTTVSEGVEKREGKMVSYNIEQSNSLLVLDGKLKQIGSISNIAPDERVYSVRFMGDIAYFVTFRQVDPLFSVDLSNPEKPKIIGALKIPGFSNYLYPYGDGKLFGIGQDADEETGRTNGVKLSMFDISNPAKVYESAKLVLGYNYSDALQSHKAILVEEDKNIIGFSAYANNGSVYCVYTLKGKEFKPLAKIELNGVYEGVRGLYIGDEFYLVTDKFVSVYDLETFQKISTLELK